MKSARRVWLQALLIVDIHTRHLLDLRVHRDGGAIDSTWTTRVLNEVLARTKRKPTGAGLEYVTAVFRANSSASYA